MASVHKKRLYKKKEVTTLDASIDGVVKWIKAQPNTDGDQAPIKLLIGLRLCGPRAKLFQPGTEIIGRASVRRRDVFAHIVVHGIIQPDPEYPQYPWLSLLAPGLGYVVEGNIIWASADKRGFVSDKKMLIVCSDVADKAILAEHNDVVMQHLSAPQSPRRPIAHCSDCGWKKRVAGSWECPNCEHFNEVEEEEEEE